MLEASLRQLKETEKVGASTLTELDRQKGIFISSIFSSLSFVQIKSRASMTRSFSYFISCIYIYFVKGECC